MSCSFNISKDKIGWYYEQARTVTNAGLVYMLLKTGGLEVDGTIADHDNVSALLAASNDACDFTNYVRKVQSGTSNVTKTVDDANNRVLLDQADLTWTDAGGTTNNAVGALLIAYDPNTTTGSDADLIPLTKHDVVAMTDGNDLILRFHADGSARVS